MELYDSKTTSLSKGQRSLKQNYSRLELNWRGLPVQSLTRCLAFKKLLMIKLVWSMISLLLILPLLVLLCLSHLLNNVNSKNNECKTEIANENVDKDKSILGALSKVEKKETRNPRTKKVNNKKSQPKKPHLCHHYGALGHTRPNCYK